MENKKYYLGLDVGSNSVGWATSDENFNILRLKGKTAWGARLFEEASDAKSRRGFRTNKRRLNRRKYRIYLLNQLFAPIITKFDKDFFARMSESNLYLEDSKINNKHYLGDLKSEKEFYKNFPTIYHLRKALCDESSVAYSDPRYVYLAIHHIIKYRGNFLRNDNFDISKFNLEIFNHINDLFKNIISEESEVPVEDVDFEYIKEPLKILDILNNISLNKKDKQRELKAVLNHPIFEKAKRYDELFSVLITGGSYSISKIFDDEKESIVFDSSYDEKEPTYQSIFGEKFLLIELCKNIFDYVSLKELLGDSKSISEAFVNVYESHKEQLKALKELCHKIDEKFNLKRENSTYWLIFKNRSKDINNYANFVGVDTEGTRTGDINSFNKYVLNILSKYEEYLCENKNYLVLKSYAEKDSLLEIIANQSTSLIPHQLHENELIQIVNNCKKIYPEIFNLKEKLIELFEFRIPYFVGPLDTRSTKYSHIVKKDEYLNTRITPWNIDEIVDFDKSKEAFMNSLTNNCRYLIGEPVLPAKSLIYERYNILNKLNVLSINGIRIRKEVRNELLNNLILVNKSVTLNQITRYLKKRYNHYNNMELSVSGINSTDKITADIYVSFKNIFGHELSSEELKLSDEIIRVLTIFTDSFDDGIKYIKKNCCDLNDEQIKILKGIQFKGWAPFSYKLLCGIKIVDDNGVVHSILGEMDANVKNFQEVLNDNLYNFASEIDKYNESLSGNKTREEMVNELIDSVPPKMRRSTIQALKIIKDVVSIKGYAPQYFSIEVTRSDDEKRKGKETTSRVKEIDALIKSFKKEKEALFKEQSEKLNREYQNLLESNKLDKLNGKALYLYFKQCGIDLYTGQPINIEDVFDSTKYDIDHIVPKRLKKDDSLDNKVLVSREYNQKIKSGIYPVPERIRCNPEINKIWVMLHKKKYLTDKKYNALVRSSELTDDEIADFVNAQLNVVNQSNITLRNALKILYPESTLIFSKAQYPTFIREELNIPKLRDLNDTHHAVDAYLNIFTGVTLHKKYSSRFWYDQKYCSDKNNKTLSMETTLEESLKKDDLAKRIKLNCSKHDQLLTYRVEYAEDRFYKATINKHSDNKLNPIHENGALSDTTKYGGYNELINAYHLVVTIKGPKKTTKKFIGIPHIIAIKNNRDDIEKYIINNLSLKPNETYEFNDKFKIYAGQKIRFDGSYYLLYSKGEKVMNLKLFSPIFLNDTDVEYLKFYENHLEKIKNIDTKEIEFKTDKNEKNTFKLSSDLNIKLVNRIKEISKAKRLDSYGRVSFVRDYDISNFNNLSLYDQFFEIRKLYGCLTRRSRELSDGQIFTPTKSFITNSNIYIIFESASGLFSKEIKI